MAERDHLARHKILFGYTQALERSDFGAVAIILNEAANDPILERMILEVNDAFLGELQIDQGTPRANHQSRGDGIGQPVLWQRESVQPVQKRQRWLVSLPLAVVAALLVFIGAMLALNSLWIDTAQPQDVEQRNRAVFERYIAEVWNTGDVSVLDDLLTDDYVEHEPGRAELTGVDAAAVSILRFRAAFPDATFIIDDMSMDNDRVWVRGMVTGTHTGLYVLPDGAIVPPSGAELRMATIAVARFEHGKIAELWMQADWLSALTEIGAVGQLVQPNVGCDVLMQQAGSLMAQARVILDSGNASIAVLVMREAEKLAAPCAEPTEPLTTGSSED